jgi:FMN phosphatase YigB (HAD superfamily)
VNADSSSTPPELPQAVIFDVDGTLCDVRSVRHFVQSSDGIKRRNADFDAFHAASISCPPFHEVQRLSQNAHKAGLNVLIVTGRASKWGPLTSQWLTTHDIPFDEVKMRQQNDYRTDHVIKEEIRDDIVSQYKVVLAVDDRPDIAAIWLMSGIPTVLVDNDGGFDGLVIPSGATITITVKHMLRKEEDAV